MAFREIWVVEIKEMLRLWASGKGLKAIAVAVDADRKTVRRYVRAAEALGLRRKGQGGRAIDDDLLVQIVSTIQPGGSRGTGAMRAHCRAHQEAIEGWLREGCKAPKLVKLLHRHTGVEVPLRTLQRFVTEELQRSGHKGTVRVADGKPGEVLEVDFMVLGDFIERGSGRKRRMHALLCTANYSRHQFVWPCLSQARQDVIEGLDAAWQFFGGIFPVVLSDNLSPVVSAADPVKPKLSEAFLEYMQARDFVLDAARIRSPKDKARVERQVQYVRNDFYAGERFGTLAEARAAAEIWCREEAGARIHGTTRRQPLQAFEAEEQPLLKPAPAEPYDQPQWSDHKVGRDHAINVDYSLYSVPHTVGEVTLRVRRDRETVKLYHGARLIKIHPRQGRGSHSIDPADLPPGTAELATRDGTALAKKAEAHGQHVAAYARRLLDDPRPWTRMRHVYRLLGLARRYGSDWVDAACAQALALDVIDVVRIDGMLKKGLVDRGLLPPPPPRPPTPRANLIPLRFARDAKEWRPAPRTPGAPDAPA